MGTREVWALVCAFLVILQKALSEVQLVRGGNWGKRLYDIFLKSMNNLIFVVKAGRQASLFNSRMQMLV